MAWTEQATDTQTWNIQRGDQETAIAGLAVAGYAIAGFGDPWEEQATDTQTWIEQ